MIANKNFTKRCQPIPIGIVIASIAQRTALYGLKSKIFKVHIEESNLNDMILKLSSLINFINSLICKLNKIDNIS